jgi:hypothetical protein
VWVRCDPGQSRMDQMPRRRFPKSPELADFAEYVEAYPSRLRCWRDGVAGFYPILAWLNTYPVSEQREMISTDGPVLTAFATSRSHHNQVGVAVGWAERYLTAPREEPGSTEEDRVAMFELARRYWLIRNLLAEVRQGVREYEALGNRVVLTYQGDRDLDALDRFLDFVDDIQSLPDPEARMDRRLREWLSRGGKDVPWPEVPGWAREQYREFAGRLVGQYPCYLPAGFDAGGFTMAEASAILAELLAQAVHRHACTLYGCLLASVVVPPIRRRDLATEVAVATGVAETHVLALLDLLTLDLERCSDPCLTPLIPVGDDRLVPMSSLIVPSSLHRNLIALLQHDHARFGEAGRQLGLLGARTTASTLGRLAGAVLATSVKVLRPDGTHAGDLDVVAYDPVTREMAVLEVMWRIGPDGSAEVARCEEAAHAKRAQVSRVRGDIEGGLAAPRWPARWPDCIGSTTSWFILTPNVLPIQAVEADGITIRSHQMLASMLRDGASVSDLVRVLESPPLPPPELSRTRWERVRYGDYRVEFDAVGA